MFGYEPLADYLCIYDDCAGDIAQGTGMVDYGDPRESVDAAVRTGRMSSAIGAYTAGKHTGAVYN